MFISESAFYLPGPDTDTDRIIPARYLRSITFAGLEEFVFTDDRRQAKGKHPFDLEKNATSRILIADSNFGCGSSREHAVAAIQRWGIRAIVAPSFAAIFRSNATANGLVCVDVEPAWHQLIVDATTLGNPRIEIDLEKMQIRLDNKLMQINMPPADRDMLVCGTWNTTTTLLQVKDSILETACDIPYMQAN